MALEIIAQLTPFAIAIIALAVLGWATKEDLGNGR